MYTIHHKRDERFLRKRGENFDFTAFSRKDIQELIRRMKKSMQRAKGVGLAANQIGLPYRVFVAEVPQKDGGNKFYSIFNPTIEKRSEEKVPMEEGCLSVPGIFGMVERAARVTLQGYDKNQKPIKIKAWGLLARVFQHEVDHLDGILFIDRTTHLHETTEAERLTH